ncbi:hypothetical protein RS130_14545 [Paraglaciecola aquimarina]|uniref:Uncharacterized protein n=1 Tax=Paraglaciecola aquimarina TaxID=1235557 RepID=A0ABU3SY76_9ALTE|nr:hypothetical protein [Paraglaciecola aquimarina]MDU0354967.1 hypothetical protein [Paraglaciecola aquimarina]
MQLKKSINFGDVSLNFQTVYNKLADLEGTFVDGFDNNIKYLLNSENWNPAKLVDGKPQVALKTRMDQYAFELHCFPIIRDEAQAVVIPNEPSSPFREYNPATFGPVLKINGLQDLINMMHRKGDDADMELIKYAHMMTEQLIGLFTHKLKVETQNGSSVKGFFTELEPETNESRVN